MGASASVVDKDTETSVLIAKLYESAPYFIVNAVVEQNHVDTANVSWNLILNNEGPSYLEKPHTVNFTNLAWFFERFFIHTSELDTHAELTFTIALKEKLESLVKDLVASYSLFSDAAAWDAKLVKIATDYHDANVLSHQYIGIGDCLEKSLHESLGDAAYCETTKTAWMTIYSRMLTVLLPACVDLERDKGLHTDTAHVINLSADRKVLEGDHATKRNNFINQASALNTAAQENLVVDRDHTDRHHELESLLHDHEHPDKAGGDDAAPAGDAAAEGDAADELAPVGEAGPGDGLPPPE